MRYVPMCALAAAMLATPVLGQSKQEVLSPTQRAVLLIFTTQETLCPKANFPKKCVGELVEVYKSVKEIDTMFDDVRRAQERGDSRAVRNVQADIIAAFDKVKSRYSEIIRKYDPGSNI